MGAEGFSALVADVYGAAVDPPSWRKVLKDICALVRGGLSASLFWQDPVGHRMSTALVETLRESIGYLRDDGYHQTARLIAVAADEIERLNRRVHALESRPRPLNSRRAATVNGNFSADRVGVDPRRHHGQ